MTDHELIEGCKLRWWEMPGTGSTWKSKLTTFLVVVLLVGAAIWLVGSSGPISLACGGTFVVIAVILKDQLSRRRIGKYWRELQLRYAGRQIEDYAQRVLNGSTVSGNPWK